MRLFNVVFMFFLMLTAVAAQADIEMRVGGDPACDFSNPQAAIDAAAGGAAITQIKIARNAAYTAQHLVIQGKNVHLMGGYADCSQVAADGIPTLIDGSQTLGSVIWLSGATQSVAFVNLNITGGASTEIPFSSIGGGVAVTNGPHALVQFDNTLLHDNVASFGGGLAIDDDYSNSAEPSVVRLSNNTRIFDNRSVQSGGGIYCPGAKLALTGDDSSAVTSPIRGNRTGPQGWGGGIAAADCVIDINASNSDPALGTISGNFAGVNGGGMVITGPHASVVLYTQNRNHPAILSDNVAGNAGGAIYLSGGAMVHGLDAIIRDNRAAAGGGGVALYQGATPDHATTLVMTDSSGTGFSYAPLPVPDAVPVNCTPAQNCNRISDNHAAEANAGAKPGAAVLITVDDSVFDFDLACANLNLSGTEVSRNEGDSVLRAIRTDTGGATSMQLDGVLIVDNAVNGTIIDFREPAIQDVGAGLEMYASTIAGNAIAGNGVLRGNGRGEFLDNIIWQPGTPVLDTSDGSPAPPVYSSIVSDLAGMDVLAGNLVADPLFENASAGDYRLQLGSPGIDYANPILGGFGNPLAIATADGLRRLIDLPTVANRYGPQDVGAYERQSGCASDTIFCHGFE